MQKTAWQVSRKRTIKEERQKLPIHVLRLVTCLRICLNISSDFFCTCRKTILFIFVIKLKYFFQIKKNFCNVKQTATETVNYNQAASSKAETWSWGWNAKKLKFNKFPLEAGSTYGSMPVDPMIDGHLSLFIEKKCVQSLTIWKQSLKHFLMKNLLMCFFSCNSFVKGSKLWNVFFSVFLFPVFFH